ncbi:probable S-adenosylmethionine-dependent methyltransferase At5g37970 [Herrania umbratica]|uniref:Probable S-adenosylmethionine-dependent methyltransferase At5g37970 n=1 Tax=Herrania umbratica TaxID=108875 RepID=A0A6J1B2Z7_9ROSI|nr:probable S-adenosylmethionine-dependent methyltransferase At5g37970 [Herrania umbratica]
MATMVSNLLKKKSEPAVNSPAQVIGGHGTDSYSNNSFYQKLAANVVKKKIEDAIMMKLDVASFSSTSNIIRLADFGCGVGSNTITAMHDLLEFVKKKYRSQCPVSQMPEFQVIFNDQSTNDFNTLFTSLPQDKEYMVAGVPGSFHDQVLPKSSLHLAHCSYSLHWLSKLPKELQDKLSPAWNKGKIHYTSAPQEVLNAYATQFAEDLDNFLNARAQEIVSGGMMLIVGSGIPDGMSYSQVVNGLMYNCMGSILMDMVKTGSINEAEIDAFNLPIYACPPGEFTAGVERNGLFTVEVIELMNPAPWLKGPIDIPAFVKHVRAAMEGMFSKHFSRETIDELFNQLVPRLSEISQQMESCYRDGLQLFAILKRK